MQLKISTRIGVIVHVHVRVLLPLHSIQKKMNMLLDTLIGDNWQVLSLYSNLLQPCIHSAVAN